MVNGVSKLEFLCDAIAEYTGSHDPRSEAYKARNPLALRKTWMAHDGLKFGELRTFRSWVHGYEASIFDLRKKCSGESASGLTKYSSIADLVSFYEKPGIAKHVADYLSFALEDEKITQETQLFIFLR